MSCTGVNFSLVEGYMPCRVKLTFNERWYLQLVCDKDDGVPDGVPDGIIAASPLFGNQVLSLDSGLRLEDVPRFQSDEPVELYWAFN